jgi:acyl dehydratase
MLEPGANDPWVGQDVAGREFTVTAEDVARYAAGTGTPVSVGRAPALCYHSEVYRDLSWYLPNIVGNLHARQEWDLFQPFRPGDRVRSRTTVVDRYRKRDRLYVVAEVLLTTPEGRWLQRSRTHQSFLATDAGDGLVVDRSREKRADRRFEVPAEGAEIRPLSRTITLPMCEAFSGPHKNYHTDREMARMLGFPDVVVQGMMSVCFVADLLAGAFGPGFAAGGKLDVRLVNVVWPGDTVTARGRLRETVTEGPRRRALCDVWCEKGDGTVTVVGGASAIV